MNHPLISYADLLLRIVKLEARIVQLEQQTSHGAAPSALAEKIIEQVRSPHWVLGEDGASAPEKKAPHLDQLTFDPRN